MLKVPHVTVYPRTFLFTLIVQLEGVCVHNVCSLLKVWDFGSHEQGSMSYDVW